MEFRKRFSKKREGKNDVKAAGKTTKSGGVGRMVGWAKVTQIGGLPSLTVTSQIFLRVRPSLVASSTLLTEICLGEYFAKLSIS